MSRIICHWGQFYFVLKLWCVLWDIGRMGGGSGYELISNPDRRKKRLGLGWGSPNQDHLQHGARLHGNLQADRVWFALPMTASDEIAAEESREESERLELDGIWVDSHCRGRGEAQVDGFQVERKKGDLVSTDGGLSACWYRPDSQLPRWIGLYGKMLPFIIPTDIDSEKPNSHVFGHMFLRSSKATCTCKGGSNLSAKRFTGAWLKWR